MTNLLNSLLDISRLDAGAVKPAIEDFPVQRLIDRLSAESARQARQKKLKFTAASTGAVIESDPNLLGEIIQNFVSNAIRYTEAGEITLGCREVDGRLSIDVCDTGIGIEESQLDNIFAEFHQLRNPGSVSEGFGLGLAIVRRLADLMGHEVVVTSTPGKGSCFSVLVPLVGTQETREAAPAARQYAADEAGGVIVLIEDDPRVAGAWTALLEAAGYQVLTAQSADGAVAAVAQLARGPDLIISDFHLIDGSNGVQAVTRIRECFGSDLPAFIVSGDTSKAINDARHLRNSVLLSKPVDTDALLDLAAGTIASGRVVADG
jgi:CheY-like chemotaxis protein